MPSFITKALAANTVRCQLCPLDPDAPSAQMGPRGLGDGGATVRDTSACDIGLLVGASG